nr:immunoglobulin light chain junction region [Macaca mulatta]MOW04760.1 immunoglobulin light chain junction region [Macaca mulatta]MOW04778.1 immunoglobulin light chain junction region [Macaca mulatta]MOW05610.1 immunoglobulin light chain junction region [Macaca mulatta]MOW05651.1 immunoglobulin light chain junction region [Macaca mulatta]
DYYCGAWDNSLYGVLF